MLSSSSLLHFQLSPSSLPKLSTLRNHGSVFALPKLSTLGTTLPSVKTRTCLKESSWKKREVDFTCFSKTKEKSTEAASEEKGLDWPILERWDVPWQWQTVLLTMVACGVSFALTGLVEAAALPYLGFQSGDVSLDDKAGVLFAGQFTVSAVVLGVIYGITNTFQPLPDDLFRYDLKEPFSLRNGWILWAGVGLVGAVVGVALLGYAMSIVNGEPSERDTDALVQLLPLIGSSSTSTAFLIGITGVLAPILEETVFRGFLMASLTKWFPTPIAVFASGAVFALAHLTPGQFPQLFVLGSVLGFSYAQTRNLMTPITIHALWNSGVIVLLTFLQLQGYDIKELLQAS